MTKFEITKKIKLDSDGNQHEFFYLKRTFFGISFYKWSIDSLTNLDDLQGASGFLLLFVSLFLNLIISIEATSFLSILLIINPIFIYLFYKLGIKKYYRLCDAEYEIKVFLKKNNFKNFKEETISSYNIDLKNGVVEKSVQTRNLN